MVLRLSIVADRKRRLAWRIKRRNFLRWLNRTKPVLMIGRVVNFAGKNWEPITALLAFVVSVWTAIATHQSIGLASSGVKLAEAALREQTVSNRYERYPFLSIGFDGANITLNNDGLSPVDVFAVVIRSGEELWLIEKRDNNVERYGKAVGAIVKSLELFGAKSADGGPMTFHFSNPLKLIPASAGADFVGFSNVSFPQEPIRYFESVGFLVCYTNLLGEFTRAAKSGAEINVTCPDSPLREEVFAIE